MEPRPSSYLKLKFRIVPTKEHVEYIEQLRNFLRTYKDAFSDREIPLACMVTYYLPRSKHNTMVLPTCTPDLDNLSKPMLDALKPKKVRREIVDTGVVGDDAQITDLYVRKRFAKLTPQITIEIWKIQINTGEESLTQAELFHLPTQYTPKTHSSTSAREAGSECLRF